MEQQEEEGDPLKIGGGIPFGGLLLSSFVFSVPHRQPICLVMQKVFENCKHNKKS